MKELIELVLKFGNGARVAKALNVNPSTVSRWIGGKIEMSASSKIKIKALLEKENDTTGKAKSS